MKNPLPPRQPKASGKPAPPGPVFEFSGGELCLDFANTVDSRPTSNPRELLPDYPSLVEWSLQAGTLCPPAAKKLRKEAARRPRRAAKVLKRGRRVREATFELFSAAARGGAPPQGPLATLNKHLPGALAHLHLGLDPSGYQWEWRSESGLDEMLWPVLRSTADLLTSDRLDRIRVCSAEDCDWLFLDSSRNRSRRWCDMAVCGNRSKVRRFRQTHSAS